MCHSSHAGMLVACKIVFVWFTKPTYVGIVSRVLFMKTKREDKEDKRTMVFCDSYN